MNGCPWETVQCFVAENLWLQWWVGGWWGGGTWTSNLMTNSLPMKFELSRPDAFYIMFQNDTSALATAFYFNWWRMDDLKKFYCDKIVLWQKCLTSRRMSTQNLRIHGECSAIWSGFWPILVPDRIKSVQNTLSQRTGLVILWSAACNPILPIFTGT